jgi:hypothetical protein
VKRFASVRYDGVLAPGERQAAARTLASSGAEVTSWSAAAGRTYAGVVFAPEAPFATERPPVGRIDVPPLVALRIVPDASRALDALVDAFTGDGRPAGLIDARRDGDALVIELDTTRTPLDLVVAAVDIEIMHVSGRRIQPLLPFDDATLTAFAGALLGEPDLEPARLIETHLEPLLGQLR